MGFFSSTPQLEDVLSEARKLLKESQLKATVNLLNKARKKNLFHPELTLLWSKVHSLQGDQNAQYAEIKYFMDEYPNDVLHHLRAIQFLIEEDDHATAQHFLHALKRRFPLSGFVHSSQALLHCKQGEYELASSSLLQKKDVKILDDGDTKTIHLIKKGVGGNPQANALKLLSDPQVRYLLLRYSYERFESLGGDCEFGFHQRRHGREPLGLFRWGGMPRERMIELFHNQLRDFASTETAALKPNAPNLEGGESLEYYFHDRKYAYFSHTNVSKKSVDFFETEDNILARLRPHFLMLVRKLQEDLEDAEKAFVFKSREDLTADQCIELHDAMCTMGNNKLIIFLLKQEAKEGQAGQASLDIIRPNLLVARVSAWWGGAQADYLQPVTREWDAIIERAYQHFVTHYPEMDIS